MSRMEPNVAWRHLLDAATARYRAGGHFAYHFARGKLSRDPVFRYLLERGLLVPDQQRGPVRMLDIGSGQSLLASLAHESARLHARGSWPEAWVAPPLDALRYTGIELMPKDTARASAALADLPQKPTLINGDMGTTSYPDSDVVVILDVLHYVDIAAQDAVLQKVHAALRRGGHLLLRIGDMDAKRGFLASQWVDRVVTNLRGHRAPPTWGRPLSTWVSVLESIGFEVQTVPKSEGTPFANVLLVARKREEQSR